MSLASLKSDLKKKAEQEAELIKEDEKAEARKIREDARHEAKKILDAVADEARPVIEKERMQVSAARLKAKKIIQDAKFEVVQDAVDELKKLVGKKAQKKTEYEKLLRKLIKDAIKEVPGEFVIQVLEKDKSIAKEFGEVSKAALKDSAGGAVVSSKDGRVTVNNTLEALLEENDEELKQKAFQLLFK